MIVSRSSIAAPCSTDVCSVLSVLLPHCVICFSMLCTRSYLAAWDVFPSNYGLLTVDTSSSNYTHTFTESDYLLHAVGCDSSDTGKALVIGSIPKSADTSATFVLLSYDIASAEETKIAEFPDPKHAFFEGMDAEFRFTADGKTAIMVTGKVEYFLEK